MTDEAGFIQAILAAPQDDGLRLVYADWLEERGDTRADFLRTQVLFASLRPKHPRRAILARRLRQLRQSLDAAWLASLDRPPIENCGLQFRFACPKQWEALRPTENASVRFCDRCERRVFYCHSVGEARGLALRGECVAVDTTLTRNPGDVTPPPASGPGRPRVERVTLGIVRIALPDRARGEDEDNGDWEHRQRDGRRGRNRRRRQPQGEG
jgi:uncharacterized protein (TIGR02996 family)